MPWLRERISGWACVSLWLLPNVLYIIQIQRFAAGMPLFVIVTSGDWAFTLLSIWLAGCCLLLLYKIAEHLVFRRRYCAGAVEAEPEAQALLSRSWSWHNSRDAGRCSCAPGPWRRR